MKMKIEKLEMNCNFNMLSKLKDPRYYRLTILQVVMVKNSSSYLVYNRVEMLWG